MIANERLEQLFVAKLLPDFGIDFIRSAAFHDKS
jgi:hypothetical protein